MRTFLGKLAIVALTLLGALLLLTMLATDGKPLVERSEAISPNTVAQAKRLLAANDPRQQQRGEVRTVVVPASLIDEGVNYLAGRYLRGRGALRLQEDGAGIALSVALPVRRFLNLRAVVAPAEGMPRIASAHLGSLPVPAALVELAVAHAITVYGFEKEWELAGQALRKLSFDAARGTASLTYAWEPGILDRARAAAQSEADIKRLRESQLSLAALLAHRAPGTRISLAEVLGATIPMSEDASLRGRATLLVLASHLAGKDLAAVVPAARNWPRVRWVNITLAGRHDLAQHFVISAALAAWAGEPVADAIGLYKELEDARHGSGFSFIDLAADRAGTRFGEILIRNPEQLMAAMNNAFRDEQLLPAVSDLPEYLSQPEFKRRFENPESPQFKAMAAEIERRLDTLPLYR
jgi:hypothetical protein